MAGWLTDMTSAQTTSGMIIDGLTLAAALGAGLSAGVFLAFSSFVMTGLGRLPDAVGVAAMQAINRAAPSPVFMIVLFGTAALTIGVAVAAIVGRGPGWILIVGAAVAYLISIGLTIGYHVPRNELLATLDPGAPTTVAVWRDYLRGWTRLNHVRTIGATAGCLLLIIAYATPRR